MRRLNVTLLILGAIALPGGALASHDDHLRDEWPTIAADAARSGSRGHTTGPGTGETIWRFQTDELDVLGTPAVASGKVFIGGSDKNIYALDAKNGSLVWRYETGDFVRGSPIVANDSVFIASWDGHLYAIDASDGSLRWRVWIEPFFEATPTFADGTIYFGTKEGPFMALNASDGTTRWTFDADEPFGGRPKTTASPIVLGDAAYFGSGNSHVYKLDRATGTQLWRVLALGADPQEPLATDGKAIFLEAQPRALSALDIDTGETLWTKDIPVRSGSPSIRNGTLFLVHNEGAIAVNATTGEDIWSQPNLTRGSNTIAITDTTLYLVAGADSAVTAIDAATGEIRWERVIAAFISGRSSPVVADGILYLGSSQYRVFALDAGSGLPVVSPTPPPPTQSATLPTPGVALAGLVIAITVAFALSPRPRAR